MFRSPILGEAPKKISYFNSVSIRLAPLVMFASMSVGGAFLQQSPGTISEFDSPAVISGNPAMITGAPVMPPAGFIDFCVNNMPVCQADKSTPGIIDINAERSRELRKIQRDVNIAIKPKVNPSHAWRYPVDGYGDCNSYVLEKQRELMRRGWPKSALLMTVATTETGEGHLVLVARTNEGDLVLDNRTPQVVDWSLLPYRWISQQSANVPSLWLRIITPALQLSAAQATKPLRLAPIVCRHAL